MKKLLTIFIALLLLMSSAIIPASATSDITDAIIYETSEEGFTLSVTAEAETSFTDSDRLSITVLKPGYNFNTEYTKSQFKEAVCFVDACGAMKSGETYIVKFPLSEGMPYGIYNIRVSKTDMYGNLTEAFYKLNNIDPAELLECVENFKNFDPETGDLAVYINEYVNEKEFMRWMQIPELKSEAEDVAMLPENYETTYSYVCGILEAEGKMNNISDVINCLNAAYVVNSFDEQDSAITSNLTEKYKNIVSVLYDTNANIKSFLKVYADLKANVQDAESLKEILKWSGVLSYIQDGTRKTVKEAIEKNAELLGCDLQYAEDKNVSLDDVVVYIETTNASNYYENSLGNDFKEIVDDIAGGKLGIPGVSTGGGSTGGGGSSRPISSGGTSGTTYVPQIKTEETDNPVESLPQQEEVLPFNDIAHITWAKDHIVSLMEKGIVSGNGDGTFAPDRLVTREEFVKMLVHALEIDIVANKDVSFDDCRLDAWYYPYIQIAVSNGVVNGIDRYNFGVGKYIKRQDMAVMVKNALAVKKFNVGVAELTYQDSEAIAEYAKDAVAKMSQIGIINGMGDGNFSPDSGTTRAQAAVIIGRVLDYMGGAE